MSTTGIESWAVDLKDIGAIYPFQGSEGLLVLFGVISWVAWHIWQLRFERETQAELIKKNSENIDSKTTIDHG